MDREWRWGRFARARTYLGSVAAFALLGLFLGACNEREPAPIDEPAFAKRVQEMTAFDAAQSKCIADEVFRIFKSDTIKSLYEKGIEPLRFSLEGQTYVLVTTACTTAP